MKCRVCGELNDPLDRVCPECGERVARPTNTSPVGDTEPEPVGSATLDGLMPLPRQAAPEITQARESDGHQLPEGYEPGSDPFAGRHVGAERSLRIELYVTSRQGDSEITLEPNDAIQIGRKVGPLTGLCTDNISGDHARIEVGETCAQVRDTGTDGRGSTNGTYVNGTRIPAGEPVEVHDNDVVTCGTDPPLTINVKVTRS